MKRLAPADHHHLAELLDHMDRQSQAAQILIANHHGLSKRETRLARNVCHAVAELRSALDSDAVAQGMAFRGLYYGRHA